MTDDGAKGTDLEPPSEALAEGIEAGTLPAAIASDEPGPAIASPDALTQPHVFPDDGAFARQLRVVDRWLGFGEQVVLFGMLAAVVITASIEAIWSKAFGESLLWSFYVIRAGTFGTAMIGAAFASHQQRHLAMDLVSRRLRPRGRLILNVFLGAFTISIAFLLARAGAAVFGQVAGEGASDLIPPQVLAAMIPVGAGLVIIHTLLFVLIDIDYLIRGKLPPERARTGH